MNNKISIIYYLIMLIILVSWSNPESLPPLGLRLAFLFFLIMPLALQKSRYTALVILTFVVISASSYAVSYMPVDGLYLSVTCLFSALVLGFKNNSYGLSVPFAFNILLVISFFIDFFFSKTITISYVWLVVIIISSFLIYKNDSTYFHVATFSFALISIVLSIEFLAVGDEFVRDVHTILGNVDRKGWADPNYFGAVVGMGILISLIEILFYENNFKQKIFYLVTIILSIYTIISIASRGAIVSLIVSFMVLLLFSKIQIKYKLYSFLIVTLFFFVMYQLGFLDLLLLRFVSDEGDLGGRGYIWETRLSHFFSDLNVFQWFFGIGREQALTLGTGRILGFHNDFISVLVCYGFIGLVCLFFMLISPIIYACKQNKPIVFALVLYLALCMCSIEPFTGGQWGCLYFYIYILMLSQNRYDESKI